MADFTPTDVHACLANSAEVKLQTASACSEAVIRAAEMIVASLKDGGKLMFCGNGALALTTDTSFLTAYANDFGFEGIFARQVETLGRGGYVLVAISTSGNSANVVAACEAARSRDIRVCAMTGEGGGRLADHADVLLAVPSRVTMHIQESHIALGHVMTLAVERMMDL